MTTTPTHTRPITITQAELEHLNNFFGATNLDAAQDAALDTITHPASRPPDRIIAKVFLAVCDPQIAPRDPDHPTMMIPPDDPDDSNPAAIIGYLGAAIVGGFIYLGIWHLALWAWAHLT